MYKRKNMMARDWFINIGGCDGNILDAVNYVKVISFPSCVVTGNFICAVAGVYSPLVHGRNPEPFSNNLKTYIIEARAALNSKPSGSGQRRYVYVTPFE